MQGINLMLTRVRTVQCPGAVKDILVTSSKCADRRRVDSLVCKQGEGDRRKEGKPIDQPVELSNLTVLIAISASTGSEQNSQLSLQT